MKNVVKSLLLLSFIFVGSDLYAQKSIKGNFEHVVLFWMNNPEDQEERALLEKGMKDLIQSSKYIISSHVGVPAMTDREVVDNSYTYNYTVTFHSKEDQDAYQVEPVHLEFVERYKHLWSKVQIYDSINILDKK